MSSRGWAGAWARNPSTAFPVTNPYLAATPPAKQEGHVTEVDIK
jgi:hypothetical protein